MPITLKAVVIDDALTPLRVGWPEGVYVTREASDGIVSVAATCSDGADLVFGVFDTHAFLRTISSHALTSYTVALREQSEWAYIIVVGSFQPSDDGYVVENGLKTRWKWHSMAGAQASVQEAGVTILHVAQWVDVPPLVTMLAKRERGQQRVRSPRDFLFPMPDFELLLSIPGIGESHAEALLREFGTAAMALIALSREDWDLPKGIGAETRKAAREALGLPAGVSLELSATIEPPPANVVSMEQAQVEIDELFGAKAA